MGVFRRYFEIHPAVAAHERRWYTLCLYAYPLGFLFHAGFFAAFWSQGLFQLAYLNIMSMLLWLVATALNRLAWLNIAFVFAIVEVTVHAAACVLTLGWASGFQYYIIDPLLFTSLCTFPLWGKFVSWVANIAIFVFLYFYQKAHSPLADVSGPMLDVFYIANAVGTFWFILFLAYIFSRAARRLEDALAIEHGKSEDLLLNILPRPIAERLKMNETIADSFAETTVLFADICDFTALSARISAEQIVALLNEVFSVFDRMAAKFNLEKIKTIGDAYMVAGGIPEPRGDHAEAVAEMALAMQAEMAAISERLGQDVNVRIGIGTGPVVAGVIGIRKFIYDLWGDTVNTASRMESLGTPGSIQVTDATYRVLCHRYHLEERGQIEVKGKGPMKTYFLVGRR